MFGTLSLGKIAGIKVRLHWTFFLLLIYIFLSKVFTGSGLITALFSLSLVVAIFGCVLLHELGHALAARQFGIRTRNITLLPIGGVAALERLPREPWKELWIAVAGPLVNVVIAAVLGAGFLLSGANPNDGMGSQFVNFLILSNVILVVFNMIPAFPMDGGRVLRSLLATFMTYSNATRVAVRVGSVLAVAMGLFGLIYGDFMLVILAIFVYMAGAGEGFMVMREQRGAYPENQEPMAGSNRQEFRPPMWTTSDTTVPSSLPTSSAAALLEHTRRDQCVVIDAGRAIGIVTRSQLISALAQGYGSLPVGQLVV